jgi:CheY-like chemotaxis protein
VHALVLALHENENNSKRVAESLKLSGHDVVLSKNFSHAIEILKNMHVDLIISDVHLENGGNVFDFLRWARNNPATKNIPFVMLSTEPTRVAKHVEDGVRTSARALGVAMYIAMETFDQEEFRRKIDSLLPAGEQATELSIKER